jgi:HSP20 family molecular chaperone IbpA
MTSLVNRERSRDGGLLARPFSDLWSFDPLRVFTTQPYGVDIARTDSGYTVEVPVPGFKPDQIEVTLEDGMLTVKGRNDKRNFSRTFTIPEDVDEERIEANVEHGMLMLTLTLLPKAQPKRISVKSAS